MYKEVTMNAENNLMETFTGKYINPLNLQVDDIDIEDIAHSLSIQSRYQGHCKFPYSVAQHCLAGLEFIEDVGDNKLAWLLHDSSEAYLHDIVSCVKALLLPYVAVELNIQALIYRKFDIVDFNKEEIHRVDYGLMAHEASILMNNTDHFTFPELPIRHRVVPMGWYRAESMFLEAFRLLITLKNSRSQNGH
jgi:hypothetical protein